MAVTQSVLTLKTIGETKLLYSDKTSTILRQLVLAGVAVSWLFLYNEKKGIFSSEWLCPLILFLLAISLDLLQYKRGTDIFDQELTKVLQAHTKEQLEDPSATFEVS